MKKMLYSVFLVLLVASVIAAAQVYQIPAQDSDVVIPEPAANYAIYAKFDGIDGESNDEDHTDWIDVLSFDWGMHKPGGGMTGQSRRRGAAVVEDLTLTYEYEKASPKLAEKLAKGEVIPKLEIEFTTLFDGAQKRYLKYELKNVMLTSYHTTAVAGQGRPEDTVKVNFEEIKVTYTEYDETGASQGNVEWEYKVEKGE